MYIPFPLDLITVNIWFRWSGHEKGKIERGKRDDHKRLMICYLRWKRKQLRYPQLPCYSYWRRVSSSILGRQTSFSLEKDLSANQCRSNLGCWFGKLAAGSLSTARSSTSRRTHSYKLTTIKKTQHSPHKLTSLQIFFKAKIKCIKLPKKFMSDNIVTDFSLISCPITS